MTIPREEGGLQYFVYDPSRPLGIGLPTIRDGEAPEGHLGWPLGFLPLPGQCPLPRARWAEERVGL